MRRRRISGQALTEFALVATVTVVVLVGITGIFLVHIGDFYENVVKVMCLPIP